MTRIWGLKKVEANRNFANKIWNVGRFMITAISCGPNYCATDALRTRLTLIDWILAEAWIWAAAS